MSVLEEAPELMSEAGRGSGGGRENNRDVLRRFAVGDILLIDILTIAMISHQEREEVRDAHSRQLLLHTRLRYCASGAVALSTTLSEGLLN